MEGILLIVVIGIIIFVIYKYKTSESFKNSKHTFVGIYGDKIAKYLSTGKLVVIVEQESKLALTFNYRTGFLRLQKFNPINVFQYWLIFPDGQIMQPYDKMCLDYIGYDFPPFVNICTSRRGQHFKLLTDGTIVNDKHHNICLTSMETKSKNVRTPILRNCETKKHWIFIPMCENNYYNALASLS